MTVIALESLPLGFRFRPTDVEIVNHYLKRKITGEIGSDARVIPEIDVCKCEPWDLPDRSLIKSDDPEWFFFAPKDRKYPNGSRSNRATKVGYWKATGKDRVIRTKSSKKQPTVIGMKKTLVFHQGRAPNGVRTNWIMHEYRTTEPEFDSRDQGGYVLYRLFKKPEERSPGSNAEEMERSGLSPTPSRSSPGDIHHDPDVLEEITTPLDQDSLALPLQPDQPNIPDSIQRQPTGILRWLDDRNDCLPNYPVKPVDNGYNIVSCGSASEPINKADPLLDVVAPLPDINKRDDADGFPNICFPMTTFATNDPSFGNINHTTQLGYPDFDNNPEFLRDLWNIVGPDSDECSPWTSKVQDDPNAGQFDQGDDCLDASNYFDGSEFHELLAQIPDEFLEMKPQFSTIYENVSLLPYDSTDPDAYSMDSAADCLQGLFNNEELSMQKNVINNGNSLAGTLTAFSADQAQPLLDANPVFSQQGIAARRLRFQTMLYCVSGSEANSAKEDSEDQETTTMNSKDMPDSMEESTTEVSVSTDAESLEPTGITIRTGLVHHSSSSNLSQPGTAVRRLRLQCKLQVGPMLSKECMSGSCQATLEDKVRETEIGEHVGQSTVEEINVSGASLENKLKELSIQEDTSKPVQMSQEAEGTVKLRKKTANNDKKSEIKPKGLNASTRAPGKVSVAYITCLALSVTFLFLSVIVAWRSSSSKSS